MIITSLDVAGFGRIVDRHFAFTTGLNVVFGPNESGKSTLANAIVATLYGVEQKKKAWRPWLGPAFATRLTYRLVNGEQIEIQRDFDRDAKGLHVYDRSGNEISSQSSGGKFNPGEEHLGIPLEVFLNAACVKQQSVAIDAGRDAAPIAAHLARALDGGPREDAALGAIARLEEALRVHVGSGRARKNAPLRSRRTLAQEQQAKVDEARARLQALDDLRKRLERAGHDCERLANAGTEIERRVRSLRAGTIAQRLANLHAFRAELAALQADRAAYDDVAAFPAEREPECITAFAAWSATQHASTTAQAEARSAQLSDAERTELERRRRDAGSIDEATFEALTAAHARATAAHTSATVAAREAAATRVDPRASNNRNAWLATGLAALCVAVGCAIAHSWTWTALAAIIAVAGVVIAYARDRERTARVRRAQSSQSVADDALRAEEAAGNAVRAVLEPLGIAGFDELVARRNRLAELFARKRNAERSLDRARAARLAAEAANATFDRVVAAVVPIDGRDRIAAMQTLNALAARRRERDGIVAHLHALEMRRSTILGSDDEYLLEAELRELQRAGVDASDEDTPGALRVMEAEARAVTEALRIARETSARLGGELEGAQSQVPDLAALDEEFARTTLEIARIEAFERAVTLAKTTLEARTQEIHAAFARRLEDYAAATLETITAGRYAQIFVDPANLAIRVRVPETGAIHDLATVSAGTRDQTYLVVRFAMARMFAEGIETPPLLLDDPFAYWDNARIERCLPVIEHAARDAQAILFTASAELAAAAVLRGARRLDLADPLLAAAR